MPAEFQAVVLAAGRGSRMTDLTARTPKALLPIANKPMIWYPLKTLENAGFEDAIVIVQEAHVADIRNALVAQCEVQMKLDFVTISANDDWGTADSLRHIKDKIKTDVLVMSCDLITDLALHLLADLHRTYDATVTMMMSPTGDITEMAAPGGKSSRKIERDIIGFDEKGNRVLFLSSEADFDENVTFKKSFLKKHPRLTIKSNLTDCHMYLMKKWILDYLFQDRSINTIKGELLPLLVRKQFGQQHKQDKDLSCANTSVLSVDTKPAMYNLDEEDDLMKIAQGMSSWRDHRGDMNDCYHGDKIRCYAYVHQDGIAVRSNSLLTYCEANRQVPRMLSSWSGTETIQRLHAGATIHQKSQTGSDSMVGDGSKISEKVGIKRSVIGNHCSVGEKVKVTNSVIMDHVTIEEGAVLTGCVICNNAHIGEKSELKDCLVGASHNIVAMGKFTNEVIVDVDQMMEI